jgi:hypothetical protein
MSTMNKEERNMYDIHIPHWLWRFVPHCIPHCFITPQHILEKPAKKDWQIFDASWKYGWDLIPVNAMTSIPMSSELKCKFDKVLEDILIRAHNLCVRDGGNHCSPQLYQRH